MRLMGSALAALLALGAAGLAQARSDVYWSVGVNAAPGVSLGVGNAPVVVAPPVYVAPQPVYVAPPPVVYRPAPVYYAAPAPVYYGAAPVYYGPPGGHWKHRHWRHGRWVYVR